MGLDWLVGDRAKQGCETRFRELLERVVADEELQGSDVVDWLYTGMPAFATVGAPRVGFDKSATRWALSRIRSNRSRGAVWEQLLIRIRSLFGSAFLTEPERRALRKLHGYYVLELAPQCDGLPYYTHGGEPGVSLTDFRGKFLELCEDVIGQELLEKAWNRMLPEDVLAYGRELRDCASLWAARHDCEAVLNQWKPPPGDWDSPEALAHIVDSAGRWCVYWGERGHWLNPWY